MLVGTESRSCMDCCGRMLSKHEARLSRGYRGKEGAKALLGVPWIKVADRLTIGCPILSAFSCFCVPE